MSGPKQSTRGGFKPRIESLEERQTPAGLFVGGVGDVVQAGDPEVSLYAGVGPAMNNRLNDLRIDAFSGTAGDTRVALGDVNGDGTDDIIAATGFGTGATVAIYDGASAVRGTAVEISRFAPYANFQGGVFVAAADLNGDGFDEVVTTPGLGGRGHLKVFDFHDGSGNFRGSSPDTLSSAYIYRDYNGEVRVATLFTGSETLVVTSSGAGTGGDVRLFRDAEQMGPVPDRTSIPGKHLAAQLLPFGTYKLGLSVGAGDTDGDGDDELFVSQNGGDSLINVYDTAGVLKGYAAGKNTASALASFKPFASFNGEVRIGAADTDGDGKVEVLATTGFSGDKNGTPFKAFERTDTGEFKSIRAFYGNVNYQGGAWLSGKDFELSRDVTSFVIVDDLVTDATAQFGDNTGTVDGIVDLGEVSVLFPNAGPIREGVTGGNLAFRDAEVSFTFEHPVASEVVVSLLYTSASGGVSRLVLFDGTELAREEFISGMAVTISDRAASNITGGKRNEKLTGRFRADGGSIAAFVRSLPDRDGTFSVLFEDAVEGDAGTLTAAPTVRLLY